MPDSLEFLTGFVTITLRSAYLGSASAKKDSELNFMELCCMGREALENIDNYIADWHSSPNFSPLPLHEFLGMTQEEYARYVECKSEKGGPLAEEEVLKEIVSGKLGSKEVEAFYVYDTAAEILYVSFRFFYFEDVSSAFYKFYGLGQYHAVRVAIKMERHESPKECIHDFLKDIMDGFHIEKSGTSFVPIHTLTLNQFILSSTGCSRVKIVKIEGVFVVPAFLLRSVAPTS